MLRHGSPSDPLGESQPADASPVPAVLDVSASVGVVDVNVGQAESAGSVEAASMEAAVDADDLAAAREEMASNTFD